MSTSLTRFEVLIPNVDPADTTSTAAVASFQSSLTSLVEVFVYQTNNISNGTQFACLYGYLTAAQATTALGYLNTLNSSLLAPYKPVTCTTWTGGSQP